MKHFKAEQFLKDLGIDLEVEMVVDEVKPNNIIQLPVANLGSFVAIERTLDNLIATYGKDELIQGLKEYINGKK